jgi:hypothetical protein
VGVVPLFAPSRCRTGRVNFPRWRLVVLLENLPCEPPLLFEFVDDLSETVVKEVTFWWPSPTGFLCDLSGRFGFEEILPRYGLKFWREFRDTRFDLPGTETVLNGLD